MQTFWTITLYSSLIISLSLGNAIKRAAPSFEHGTVLGHVSPRNIDEASGVAASRLHPGYLYTHNDHGGDAEIFVLSTTGDLAATLTITGATSNDWEDIAVGPCDSTGTQTCIYVGDTGDGGPGANNYIYKLQEPATVQDQTVHLTDADRLQFSWNQVDCETLMVDPDANLIIVSKVDGGKGTIAQLPNTAWGSNMRVQISSTAVLPISTTHNDPLGGDISPDGNEVLIKTRENVYYWSTGGSRDYSAILQTSPTSLPYIHEQRGEGVCWDPKGQGYYTMGEGHHVPIYYYARSGSTVVG